MSDKPMPHEEPVMGWKTEKAVLKARSGTVSGAGQSFLRGTLPGRRDSAASLFTPRSPIPPPPSYSAPPPPSTPAPPPPVSIAPSSSSKPAPAVPSLSQLEDSLAAAKLLTTAPPPPPRNNNSNNFDDDDDDDSEPFLSPFTSPRSRPGEEDGESMLSPRSEDELTSPMKPRDNKSMSASSEKKFKRRAIQFVAYNWASTPNVHLDNAGPLSYGQPSPLGLARKGDSPIVSNTSRRDTDRAKAQSLPLTGSVPSSTSSSSGGVTPLSPSVLTTAPLSLSASASSSSSSSSDSTRVHSLDTKPINSIIGSCSPSNYQRPQTQQQQQQQNTVSLLRHTYITPSSPPVSPSQKTVSAEGFPESISKLKLRQSLLKKIQTVESQKASEGNKGLLKSPFASPSHTSSSSSHSSPSSSSQHKPPSSSMASILVLPIPPPSSSSSSSSPPDSDSSFAPRLLEAVDRQPSTVGDANQLPIKITQNSFFTCTESPPQGSETNKHIHNFLLSIGDARLRSAITEAVFPPKRQYRVTRSSLPVVVPNTDAKSNLPGAESPSPSDGSTPPSSINSSSSSGPSSVEEDDLASLELLLSQMEEDDDKDLVMMPGENGIPIIKSGSVDKLIERLTYEKFPDQDYLSAFLLTYRSFTTPAYVLKKMIERFHLLDTPDLPSSSPQFVKFFNERKRKPIQIRTCNAIKRWVENYWYDFHSDEDLITQLLSWVQGPLLHRSDGAYINLALIIEKTITKKVSGESSARKIVQEPIPPVYRPKPSDALLDCDPEEIARQLSMLEFEVYANIEPKECLNQSYNKDNRDVTSPNIVLMINRTNAIYKWVATAILQRPKLKPRVRALRTFILVAKELMKINNFNGVMEILSGMAAASVFRLHKTWDALDKKVQEMYDEMVTLMDTAHNSKTYRKMLKNCNPPCLPYIGRYLTDLTFTEDGHQTIQDNMVNFVKCRQLAVVIRQIQQYQQLPYNFTVVPEIYQALVQITNVEFPSEEELYRTSLEVEPREPKPPLS